MRQSFIALLAMLAATCVLAGESAQDRIIVRFAVPVSVEQLGGSIRTGIGELDALNRRWQVAEARRLYPGEPNHLARRMGMDRVWVLAASGPIDVEAAVAEYSAASQVEHAEPDYVGHGCATVPNDGSYAAQWALKNTGQSPGGYDAGIAGCDIDAELAWDIERGSRDVVIGHLDSGTDLDHPEFVANFQASVWWRNDDEVPRNNTDDDGNGYRDDTLGWNFVNDDNDPQDDLGHGTHTAGTIGAHTNNSTGVAGVAWYCRIMPIKVIDSGNNFYYSDLCDGIYYAVNNGARILNMSLGGTTYSSEMETAVNYAWNSGVLPIAAMGNYVTDDSIKFYPAAYANVIAVGATANDDERMRAGHNGAAKYSVRGSWIDVCAPGNVIYSTLWDNSYKYDWGTSMATPHVVGTAALMLSRNPDLTNSEVKNILQSSAEDLGTPGFDSHFGHGRINAYQALQQVQWLPGWTSEAQLATSGNGCSEADVAVVGQNVHLVYIDRGGANIGLYYRRSTNGGRTWEATRLLATMTHNWVSFHPQVAASGTSIRVVYHDKRGAYNAVYLKQSTDNGATWWADITISNTSVESSNPDVCTSGDAIHVVWNNGYRRSTNGGSNWDAINASVSGDAIACANGKVYVAGHVQVSGAYKLTFQRYNGASWESAVQFASNGTSWPNPDIAAEGNNVYIAWDHELDTDGAPEQVRFRRSTDCGVNWLRDQYLASVDENYVFRNPRLSAAGGRVNLVWWGDRDKYWSCEIYYRRSANSGANWGNTYRLTYNGYNDFDEMPAVAAFADTVHVVWDRMASGTKSVYYVRKGIDQPVHDVSAYRIVAPIGSVMEGSVTPQAMVRNCGNQTESFSVRMRIGAGYTQDASVAGLAAGESLLVSFASWSATKGSYSVSCSTMLSSDANRANDKTTGSVEVRSRSGGGLWTALADLPSGASGRPVGKGGALCAMDDDMVLALRGNKTSEFYGYKLQAPGWQALNGIGEGREGKLSKNGAALCSDGSRYVYALKGNNTLGFWRYNISSGQWEQMEDVPASSYKVKDGAGLAYKGGFVYCLKGKANEFCRFDCGTLHWQTLTSAPTGQSNSGKYKEGSGLCAHPDSAIVYCLKAKYNEVFAYDCALGSWRPQVSEVPFYGVAGKKQKVGAGGGLAYSGGLWCLKGGNSHEVWRFDGSAWTEQESVPAGASGKRVKSGGAITAAGAGIWVLKGNKTNEMWLYTPGALGQASPAGREGVMAERMATGEVRVAIGPNPVARGFATIRFSSLLPSPSSVRIYDASGRLIRSAICNQKSAMPLDLRALPAGAYLVKVEADGFSTTQKLVLQP